jgi:hypothetical protein
MVQIEQAQGNSKRYGENKNWGRGGNEVRLCGLKKYVCTVTEDNVQGVLCAVRRSKISSCLGRKKVKWKTKEEPEPPDTHFIFAPFLLLVKWQAKSFTTKSTGYPATGKDTHRERKAC